MHVLGVSSSIAQPQIKTTKMQTSDFTTTISVDQTPKQVFDAVNNVRGWWSEEIEGNTDKLHDVFKYNFEGAHRSQIKLTEVIPNKKVVWLVLDNYFKSMKDHREWTGTKITFEISTVDSKTLLHFTHVGLNNEYECYEICSSAWTHYIQESLLNLITTGKGVPNGKGEPSTTHEKTLTPDN
jgi:hypothetical protein